MEKTIQELKNLLRELILEVGDLKERITVLEKETHPEMQPEKGLERARIELQGEGYEQIGMIYQQGYHICPVAYGEPRNEECLFCLAFLEKR